MLAIPRSTRELSGRGETLASYFPAACCCWNGSLDGRIITAMKWISILGLLATASTTYARDHMELICSAVAETKPERTPMFIHFFEHRANDGTSRVERLSTIYQDVHFKASATNKTADFSKNVPLVLKAGNKVRFRGTYSLVKTGDKFSLELAGKVTADPSAKKSELVEVAVALPCVDLSI
jgi:hypothetical protein